MGWHGSTLLLALLLISSASRPASATVVLRAAPNQSTQSTGATGGAADVAAQLPPRYCKPSGARPFVFFNQRGTGGGVKWLMRALDASARAQKLKASLPCLNAPCEEAATPGPRDWSHQVCARECMRACRYGRRLPLTFSNSTPPVLRVAAAWQLTAGPGGAPAVGLRLLQPPGGALARHGVLRHRLFGARHPHRPLLPVAAP